MNSALTLTRTPTPWQTPRAPRLTLRGAQRCCAHQKWQPSEDVDAEPQISGRTQPEKWVPAHNLNMRGWGPLETAGTQLMSFAAAAALAVPAFGESRSRVTVTSSAPTPAPHAHCLQLLQPPRYSELHQLAPPNTMAGRHRVRKAYLHPTHLVQARPRSQATLSPSSLRKRSVCSPPLSRCTRQATSQQQGCK